MSRLVIPALLLIGIMPAKAQLLDPPDCPAGYTCQPKDPYAAQRAEDERLQRRQNCEQRRNLEQDLAVGGAAIADPGSPGAVISGLGMARLYTPCN